MDWTKQSKPTLGVAVMLKTVTIVGGGLVGLATAYRLVQSGGVGEVTLLEKESRLAAHQSGHNSGVLHAALSYRPGSDKAVLATEGLRAMTAFCQEHGVAHEICGKLVVATEESERPRLRMLHERGIQNGLSGLRLLTPAEFREIEPHAAGVEALHVAEEGIVDYPAVAAVLGCEIERSGGHIVLSARVERIEKDGRQWRLHSSAGEFSADHVVTCGGLHSDRLAQLSGHDAGVRIVPFRGEYYKLRADRASLVRNLIYPVPDPAFPFLGVHFTRMIRGGIEAGPNAVLAMAREGYRPGAFCLADAAATVRFPGFWRFLARNPRISAYELYRSWSRAEFCRSLQRLVPEVRPDDLEPGGAGVRAQAMQPDGSLEEDFQIRHGDGVTHVVNAPSPAATASLAIGSRIAAAIIGTR